MTRSQKQSLKEALVMQEHPLSGVISWDQNRKEVEAAWRKANRLRPASHNAPDRIEPEPVPIPSGDHLHSV